MRSKISVLLFLGLVLVACTGYHSYRKNISGAFQFKEELVYKQRQGKYLYEKYCVVCHGLTGEGDGFNAYNLDPRPKDFTDAKYMQSFSDERLMEAIAQGGRGINKSVMMPAWGNTFRSYQISYLVAYIKLFSQKQTASAQQ